MEGRVWPHVVEVGTLPWEVVLAWYGARLRVPGERHGVRLLLLVLRDGCGAGECVFLDYPLTQRLRRSHRVRRFLEEFPVLGVHVLFAWRNLVHYSSTTLYLAVYSSVFGCCMWSTEHWILREMTLSGGAMLGSTVDTGFCVSTWLLDEFHTISTFSGLGS